jgi:hypothetical protein
VKRKMDCFSNIYFPYCPCFASEPATGFDIVFYQFVGKVFKLAGLKRSSYFATLILDLEDHLFLPEMPPVVRAETSNTRGA